jgi:hypothetical protein
MTASAAQICRDMGWTVGTELLSCDLIRRRIRITAIGHKMILAEQIEVDGFLEPFDDPPESIWSLTTRNWEQI